MDLKKLIIAKNEALAFIKRADELQAESAARWKERDPKWRGGIDNLNHTPREQGAVKRASMDLTRALADLRKPN